jgi:copper chaperone CopZ
MSKILLNVSGMKCGGCVANVEKALNAVSGIESVQVSLEQKSATVTGTADPAMLARVVTEAGYPAEVAD